MSPRNAIDLAEERRRIFELDLKCQNLAFLITCECWSAAETAALECKVLCQALRELRIERSRVQEELNFPPGGAVQGELVPGPFPRS